MTEPARRGVREGIGFGLVAGVMFAIVEILITGLMGGAPLMPLRLFASILMGQDALYATTTGTVVLGALVHLVLSGLFGLFYGLVNAGFTSRTQTHWGRQAVLGLAFGALLWFVNFQIVARIAYPWFLESPQLLQLLVHALAFGLPLALMYGGAERRVQHVHVPRHA